MACDNKDFIEAIRANIVEVVQKALLEDFDAMIDEDVVKSLGEFSTAVKNSSGPKGTVVWRPTGDPTLDILAHDAKVGRHVQDCIIDLCIRCSCAGKEQASHTFLIWLVEYF